MKKKLTKLSCLFGALALCILSLTVTPEIPDTNTGDTGISICSDYDPYIDDYDS